MPREGKIGICPPTDPWIQEKHRKSRRHETSINYNHPHISNFYLRCLHFYPIVTDSGFVRKFKQKTNSLNQRQDALTKVPEFAIRGAFPPRNCPHRPNKRPIPTQYVLQLQHLPIFVVTVKYRKTAISIESSLGRSTNPGSTSLPGLPR